MMRLLFSLLFFTYSIILSAQKISWVPYKHKQGILEDKITIIKTDDDYFLVIDGYTANLKISKHDKKTGESILSKKLNLRIDKKRYRYHSVLRMKDAAYLIVFRKKSMYYLDINPSTLSLSKPHLLFTSKISKWVKYNKSIDNKAVVFYNIQEATMRHNKIELFTFDQNLKPLWQKNITTDLAGLNTNTRNIDIDNLGNVFFVSHDTDANTKFQRLNVPVNLQITVHYITDSGSNHQTLPITMVKANIALNHILWTSEPGIINFWGFYSNAKYRYLPFTKDMVSGYFFQQLDFNTSTTHPPKIYPVLESMQQISPKINEILLKKKKRNKNIYFPPSSFHLLLDPLSHDAIITMEHNSNSHLWDVTWNDPRLFYSDIIECVRINHSGDLLWEQIINKKQRSETNMNLSHSFFYSNKKLYILFNDLKENPLNRKLKKDITAYNSKLRHNHLKILKNKSTIITLTTIDFDGHLTEQVIPSKPPIYLLTKFSERLGNTKGVLLAKVKHEYKLGIFSYQ